MRTALLIGLAWLLLSVPLGLLADAWLAGMDTEGGR